MTVQRNELRQVDRSERQYAGGYLHRQKWTDPGAASATALKSGQATSNSATTSVTTFSAQPDFPRNLVITPGGTTGDVAAGNVTVTGTNIRDAVITETFAFTADQSAATTGNKAFKTVTSVVFPIQDGNAATFNIGTGVKLGLDRKHSEAAVIDAYIDGTRETTAATMAFSASAVESNTASTNTAPNGSRDVVVITMSTDVTDAPQTTS